ncbi:MAG TPA: hypothetical protein VHI13_04460, partial [Candidatus Kapabacteria bacterium]|nr:hypothetical protein [Candidatus Kapabacteria bacterium]
MQFSRGIPCTNKWLILRYLMVAACAAALGAGLVHAQPVSIPGHYYFQKEYGGVSNDGPGYHPMERTSDNGYIMVGVTTSFNGGIYVVKVNDAGAILWSRTYTVANVTLQAENIRQTRDGGYIIAGSYGASAYLLKTDSKGNIQWQYAYQGDHPYCLEVRQTSDGGYVAVGVANPEGHNVYVLKVSSTGVVQWAKYYGGGNRDVGWSIQQAADGGYVVAGFTNSYSGAGINEQMFLMRLQSNGTVQWVKRYGNNLTTTTTCSLIKTADGGYMAVGVDAGTRHVNLVKVDSGGVLQWARQYNSGPNPWVSYFGCDIKQLSSGGYVVVATLGTISYMLKTTSTGTVLWSRAYGGTAQTTASSVVVTNDGYAMCGEVITSTGLLPRAGGTDYYLTKTDTNGVVGCNVDSIGTTTTTMSGTTTMSFGVVTPGPRATASLTASSPATQTHVACYSVVYPKIYDIGIHDGGVVGFGSIHIGGEVEPNDDPGHIWKSASIWLRTSQDNVVGSRAVGSIYEHEGEHQNPVFNGSPNYLYVMVDNLGTNTSTPATLKVYWSRSATNTGWPAHWVNDIDPLTGHLNGDLAGTVTIPALPPGENYVAELPWTPPNPALYGETQSTCSFLARIESDDDPMAYTETANTEQNTRNNNNIAWRNEVNVSAAEMNAGDPGHDKHLLVRNMTGAPLAVGLSLSVPLEEQGINPIISQGSVHVALNGLYALWHAGGSIGTGVV